MKKYDAYKPSGIGWIGEIPEGWEKCRFKNFLTLINKPSISDTKVGLENIESGSGKYLPSDSEFDGNGVEFLIDDILYGKLRPYLMKVWVAEFTGNAVGDFFVFRAKKNANPYFLKYLMLSDGFTKEADGATEGAKMPRVSSEFIMSLRYYLPSKKEQIAIAYYLDAKCANIDNVVAIQRKRIELLKELKQSIITHAVTKGLDKTAKMKDSGIDWIGKIPEGWKVKRLKLLAKIKTGTTPPTKVEKYYDSEDIKWYTPSDITDSLRLNESERYISNIAKLENAGKLFPAKTIYFVGIGATIGKVAVCDEEASCNQQVNAIIPNKGNNYLYLAYCLRCQKEIVYLMANVVTLPIMNQEKNGELKLPVPPFSEQTAIVEFLDKKCSTIDKQIAKVEKQIELLNEYKQSVITECVTGKRKVY